MPRPREQGRLVVPSGRFPPLLCLAVLAIIAGLLGSGAWAIAAAPADAGSAAQAADTVTVQQVRRGTPHDALYDVTFDGRRGVAVGAFGTVLTTSDGGANWERQAFPMQHLALLAVAMHGAHCVAVGQTGLIYKADDCKSWEVVPSVTKSRLLAVAMNERGVVYAVGAFGTILRSDDWGKSWTEQKVDWSAVTTDGAEPHLYDVHVASDGTATAVGEFELVMRTSEGEPWRVLHRGERSLFALQVADGGRMHVTGQSGALLSSSDGGTTWRSHETGTDAILTGLYATDKGVVLASGINVTVLSRDGGMSWSSLSSEVVRKAWYQAVGASVDAGDKPHLIAVGAGGSILKFEF